MSFNELKPSLNKAFDTTIWNIRSTKQSSLGCSPFSKHFKKSLNTFWKSLVSHAINLDKGKSIMSRDRAQDWGVNVTFEDGYLENAVADKRATRATQLKNLREAFNEPHYSTNLAKEVIGLVRQLTEGKANHTLNPLVENHCRIQRIRLH